MTVANLYVNPVMVQRVVRVAQELSLVVPEIAVLVMVVADATVHVLIVMSNVAYVKTVVLGMTAAILNLIVPGMARVLAEAIVR